MSPDEIKRIAAQAAHEAVKEAQTDHEELRDLVSETVKQTLVQLGIQHEDPYEMQKDFQHLRDWRISVETVRSKGIMTLVGIAVSGLVAMIWIGFKELIAS